MKRKDIAHILKTNKFLVLHIQSIPNRIHITTETLLIEKVL